MTLALSKTWGIYCFVLGLALLAYDVFYGFWDHDSGYYLLQSSLVSHGFRPWIDYLTLYPPLIALIHAAFLKLGISPRTLIWALPLVWASAAACASAFFLRRQGFRAQTAWALGSLYFFFCLDFGGNHVTLEHGVAFFGVLALAVNSFFWVGIGLACAVASKQVAVLLVIPILFRLKKAGDVRKFFTGVAVPGLLLLAWLEFKVGLIIQNQLLVQSYLAKALDVKVSHSVLAEVLSLLKRDFYASPAFEFLFIFLIMGGAYSSMQLIRRERMREGLELAAWIAVGILFQAARTVKPFPHYALTFWPTALVLMTASAPLLARNRIFRRSAYLTAVAALLLLALGSRVKTFDEKPYWKRWDQTSVLLDYLYPVSEAVARSIPQGSDALFLGNDESSLLYLADRLPLNKDWGSMMPVALPSHLSREVVVVGKGSPEVDWLLKQVQSRGYTLLWEQTPPNHHPLIAVSLLRKE